MSHTLPPYRLLDHTADIRLRIYGRSLRGLFQNAVLAVTDTLTDSKRVREVISRRIDLRADGVELLFVRLLQEVLFLFDAKGLLARRLEFIKLDDAILKGRLWGERFSIKRHPLKTEIKAVTYHGLKVIKRGRGWVAEVVLDV